MMARATRILRIVEHELCRHERALESDLGLTQINIQVIFGSRSGNPVKAKFSSCSEIDLGIEGRPTATEKKTA